MSEMEFTGKIRGLLNAIMNVAISLIGETTEG